MHCSIRCWIRQSCWLYYKFVWIKFQYFSTQFVILELVNTYTRTVHNLRSMLFQFNKFIHTYNEENFKCVLCSHFNFANSAITEPTVATLYGHTASRIWQSGMNLTREARAEGCTDLAYQFIENGLHIDVRGFARCLWFSEVTMYY